MYETLFSQGRLTLDRIRTLVEIAHAGNITKAAPGNLNRQSQYSRQLKDLERFFGIDLANRKGRRLDLNVEGLRLARIGQDILNQLQDFRATCLALPIQVTVGAYESLIHWRIASRMHDFQTDWKRLSCRLAARTTEEIVKQLTDLELDFGIVRQSAIKPPLHAKFLFGMEYKVFVPRKRVPSSRSRDALWILQNVPLALHESANDFKQALQEGTGIANLPVQLRCETAVQSSRAVLSGSFCSILPAMAVNEFNQTEYLLLEAPMPKGYERKICLAWNPRILDVRDGFRQLKDRLISCLK